MNEQVVEKSRHPTGEQKPAPPDSDNGEDWKVQCLKSCHGKCAPEKNTGVHALNDCVNYCLKLQTASMNLNYEEVFREEIAKMKNQIQE